MGVASLANHSNHHCLYKCIDLLKRWESNGFRVGIGTVDATLNSHQFTTIHEERITEFDGVFNNDHVHRWIPTQK